MIVKEKFTLNESSDVYPSRGGRKAQLIERQDPVLYAKNVDNSPIDDALVSQYEEQGFLVLENVFNDSEVGYFRQELERLRKIDELRWAEGTITEAGSGDIRSVFKIHEISSVFNKLASDVRLAGLAQYLLADNVYIHQSRVNYKPGFRGKEFYWHSDFETWHVEDGMPRMRALSMSITLTANHSYNGPLMLIPGSHRYYAVCEGETPAEHYRFSLKKQECGVPDDGCLQQLVDLGGIVTATGKPGSVIVFDCNVMHGSNSNITPLPRSNAFFVYNAISNRVVEPYGGNPPRPEYLGARTHCKPITPQTHHYTTYE
ncbi:ectoine hydroxylase [Methylomarinum sp. Ch1-1]|uniref:Ectoine hydroxylase n=1 Tax=Methylomarinum roseum TaxID=3067653 RepID=A0AAU7NY01_9GAMM|nr:ectoine hydroxylase [Methylomarinum sp. Ch1-1]MDP4522025.1 ectoine hydroxylase [Methylomarinum sp. Ch1-1]